MFGSAPMRNRERPERVRHDKITYGSCLYVRTRHIQHYKNKKLMNKKSHNLSINSAAIWFFQLEVFVLTQEPKTTE